MAQGQSFFQATGDYGAESPSWVWPTSRMDYMTAVGGSVVNLDESLSPGSQVSESAWRWSEGGIYTPSLGYSVDRPKYQEFVANTQNLASDQYRNIPDVAAMAQDVQVVGTSGRFSGSGTSAATPIWAGFMALVNQRNAIVGLGPVGFINPAIYAIGKSPALYGANFNDIVDCFDPNGGSAALNAACNPTTTETWKEVCSMKNSADCMPGYPVVPGYDLVTGWGSPKQHLISQLSATKPIGVSNVHACALRSDGTQTSKGDVYCWGADSDGELGDGLTSLPQSALVKTTPVKVAFPTPHARVVELAPGFHSTCALLDDRDVYCWGLLPGTGIPTGGIWSGVPQKMSTLVEGETVSIVSGTQHICALDWKGVLFCWGMSDVGQLGRVAGPNNDPATPGPVDVQWPADTYVVSAALGYAHTCALVSDGSVYCWGWNNFGQLGNPTNVGSYDPDPPNPTPTKVDFAWPSTPVALAAGFSHTCALLSDGTVYCWGSDTTPPGGTQEPGNSIVPLQVFVDDRPLAKVVEIAGVGTHTCALLEGGTASCWGALEPSNLNEIPQPVHDVDGTSTLSGIVAMAGTGMGDTTCFLVKDKRVVCWGVDLQGSFVGEIAQDAVPFASPKAVQF